MYLPITPYQMANLPLKKRTPRPAPNVDIFAEPFDTFRMNREWQAHIIGQLLTLTRPELWEGVLDETNEGVQGVLKFIGTRFQPTVCQLFGMQANFVEYSPQNPYSQPNLVPDGYATSPFFRYDGGGSLLPVYQENDIFIPFEAINLDPFDLFTGNLPQIQFGVRGSAEIEFKFLQTVQGGSVVISVNNPPDLGDILAGTISGDAVIIDLEYDLTSIPPETDVLLENDLSITQGETEESIVYLTFIPVLDDSLIPLRYGGGIRAIEICNTDTTQNIYNPSTGNTYNPSEYQEGLLVATYEDLRRAVRDGTMDYHAQAIAGQSGNVIGGVTLNPDGSVTVGSGSTGNPDIVATTDEILNGETASIASGFAKMLADIDDLYDGSAIDTVAQYYMEQLYDIADTDDLLLAIQLYYNYRSTPNTPYVIDKNLLSEYLFCGGINLQSLNRWAIKEAGNLDDMFIPLFSSVSDEQISLWREDGREQPRQEYVGYECAKFPDIDYIFTASQWIADVEPNITIQPYYQLTSPRLIRMVVTGRFVDSTNSENWLDYLYRHADGEIQNTYGILIPFQFFDATSADLTVTVQPVGAPEFNEDGSYQFSYELVTRGWDRAQIRLSPRPAWYPNATGQLEFKIIDLGSA